MYRKLFKIEKMPSIRRLPTYLQLLRGLSDLGVEFVSSALLAEKMNIDAILVRKDLELTGVSGTPRIGFRVRDLIDAIERFIGWQGVLDACLVGVGRMGTALLEYDEFKQVGLRFVAAFDNDPAKIGVKVRNVPVFPMARFEELRQRLTIALAVVCVPTAEAQQVTDYLVACGVRALWIFSSANVIVPETVALQREDLLSGLAVLCTRLNKCNDTGSGA